MLVDIWGGVVIDDKLKWTSHIDQLYSKLVKLTSNFFIHFAQHYLSKY
jgi:hypothetical protein